MPAPLSLPEAMIRTLAGHLRSALPAQLAAGGSESPGDVASWIAEGWEAQQHDLRYPTIGIDAPLPGERTGRSGEAVKTILPVAPDDPAIELYLQTAVLVLPLQVNIWAKSPSERSRLLSAVEAALQGDILNGSGQLRLYSAEYHDLPMSFRREGSAQFLDTTNAVGAEEWRAVFSVEASSHEVVKVETVRLIDLKTHSYIATWDRIEQVPVEIRTIFEPAP